MTRAAPDAFDDLMRRLEPRGREILALHLQGWEVDAISREIHRTERTVRRTLECVRKHLEAAL